MITDDRKSQKKRITNEEKMLVELVDVSLGGKMEGRGWRERRREDGGERMEGRGWRGEDGGKVERTRTKMKEVEGKSKKGKTCGRMGFKNLQNI
jgi:hypothetical protein